MTIFHFRSGGCGGGGVELGGEGGRQGHCAVLRSRLLGYHEFDFTLDYLSG